MNRILEVDEIRRHDNPYEGLITYSVRLSCKADNPPHHFTLSFNNVFLKDVEGWSVGKKLCLHVAPIDTVEQTELDDAYATIARLINEVRELAPGAAKAIKMKWVLTASLVMNLAMAALWRLT